METQSTKSLKMFNIELELQNPTESTSLPTLSEIKTWCETAIHSKSYDRVFEGTLSILIRVVGNDESAELNQQYRDKNGPTNVLSFPNDMTEIMGKMPPAEVLVTNLAEELQAANSHLCDLVICEPLVEKEALDQSKPLISHWAHLIIHGVLHLQGFDHITDDEALEMENLEIQLLGKLGFDNPYTTMLIKT